jgi:wyosine [tRNA(Phe)-imidazoG37] synthetase (radical SAM superfamily)
MDYVFGPVPSRRLGRSLGINNIPPKHCTYACVYCQLGDPQRVSTVRREFSSTEDVLDALRRRLGEIADAGEGFPDYLTIVPDGEPTLDLRLGQLVEGVRRAADGRGAIAVITNGSLMTDPDVRHAAADADWVSVKIDAGDAGTWRKIDRPARDLEYDGVMAGIAAFAGEYTGILATETMLVAGINDGDEQLQRIADRIARLPRPASPGDGPDVAYLSIPTRPPAVSSVTAPDEERLLVAYQRFRDAGVKVELNTGYEEGDFSTGEDVAGGILAIAAVHPIERHALEDLLARKHATWALVTTLLDSGRLIEKHYRDRTYYVTRLK